MKFMRVTNDETKSQCVILLDHITSITEDGSHCKITLTGGITITTSENWTTVANEFDRAKNR